MSNSENDLSINKRRSYIQKVAAASIVNDTDATATFTLGTPAQILHSITRSHIPSQTH